MTTERQRSANRQNARNSSGPRSAAGKARVGGNAIRHGATRRPDADLIAGFYRMIIGDPQAMAQDVLHDPLARAAWRLAEAEVRLLLARRSHDAFLLGPDPQSARARGEAKLTALIGDAGPPSDASSAAERKMLKALAGFIRQMAHGEAAERQRQGALLQRYLADAETRRQTALRHWLDLQEAKSQNKANF